MQCVKCGRTLRSERSVQAGIGPVCERRAHQDSQMSLFEELAPVPPRFADGSHPGVLDHIAALVRLLKDADKRLNDPTFSRRIEAVISR